MSTSNPRTPEDIVAGLVPHVWALLRAQDVNAAMTLLAAVLPEWLALTTEPDPPLEGRIVVTGAELELARELPLVLAQRSADQVNPFGIRVNDAAATPV